MITNEREVKRLAIFIAITLIMMMLVIDLTTASLLDEVPVSSEKTEESIFTPEDVNENQELVILDDVKKTVIITINGEKIYRDYVKGNDGAIYLVEANSDGSIKKNDGSVFVYEKCEFADLYIH